MRRRSARRLLWRGGAALAGAVGILIATPIHCGALSGAPPNPDFICRLKHKATDIDSLRRYPRPIRVFIAKSFEPMADRDQPYNNTDVVTHPAPFARFIRGGKSGRHWFLWFEHGGISYWKKVAIFDGGVRPEIEATASSNDLCATTDSLLDRLK
jgi:hypothetical protein